MAVTPDTWSPSSWRERPALHQPDWPDPDAAAQVFSELQVLPPLVFSASDLDWFVGALEETLEGAQKLGRSAVGFALRMAKAGAVAQLRR